MANTHAKLLLSTLFFQMAVTQGCLATGKGGFGDIPTTTQWFSFAFFYVLSATDLYSKESSFFIRFYEIDFMATSSKVQFVI